MRIGEITVDSYGFEPLSFYGSRNLLEYDVLIIDFDKIIFELCGKSFNIQQTRNKPIEVVNDPKYRLNDFKKYLEIGRKLVVITPYNYTIVFDEYQHELSQNFNFLNFYKIENRAGKFVEITSKNLKTIGIQNNITYTYDSYVEFNFEGIIENPFAIVKDTNFAVSFMPNEQVLFIPRITAEQNGNYTTFFKDLINCFFKEEIVKESLPYWAFDFNNKEELVLISELDTFEQEKKKIEEKIDLVAIKIEKQFELKRLFTATGNELENIVLDVFTKIGFEELPSEANRHDLILKYNEQILVVEVKGVNGSAAEKNSAHLEKWVTEYHSENEVHPKGILVVNAFKDLPIDKRTEPVFPDQMLRFATNREHCLISGLQLYGFYLAYLESNEKEKLIDDLLNTIGVYDKFIDYKEFLNFNEKI